MGTEALEASRDFWNQKAAENPYWYVSSFGPYHGRDLRSFWGSGARIWSDLKHEIGYSPSREDLVVEIGCGVGRLTRVIAPEVGRVEAFDISQRMLEIAKGANLPNVVFNISDGASVAPVVDGSADLVLAYCVFQHLPSEEVLKLYLRDMGRAAKPCALIAFTMEPRTLKDQLAPMLRLRRRIAEKLFSNGAKGLYRREWYGIRPTQAKVRALCPVSLSSTVLHGDKWLFYGRRE
jgi:SAM-dependent methyltransferase